MSTLPVHPSTPPSGPPRGAADEADDAWNAPPVPPQPRMDEEAFHAWALRENVRAEWIDGEVIVMPPVSIEHHDGFDFIYTLLSVYVRERRLGRVIQDMFVRLPGRRRRRLPDTFFVRADRAAIIGRTLIDGAPDAVFEIVSEDSVACDYRDKYLDYEAAGVREYWIVDPLARRVEAHVLGGDGRYAPLPLDDGELRSVAIEGFWLRPGDLFGEGEPPSVRAALRELGIE